ncbi:unnamed protein product [Symbiodinium sp. KB8]|nr:unnamed protein product [Symbiodinium sp. KB8]
MDPLAPPTVVALAAAAVLLGVENPTWDMVKAMLQSGDLQHKLTTTLPYQIPDERRQRALAVLRLLPDHDKACHATGSFPDDFAHFARLAPKDVHDSRDTSHAPRMHKGYVPSTASYASPKVSPGRSEGGAEGFHAGHGKEDSVGEDDALAVLVGLETAQDESEVQAESAHALRAWALNLALWDASTSVENRAAAAIQAAARARAARREAAKSRNPSGIEVVAVSEMGESDSDTGSVSSFRDLKVSQEAIDAISGQVLNITAEQMTELVQTPKPTQDMVVVAGSLCVLLNVPKPSWSTAKKVIRKRGFLKKLSMVHPSLLEEKSRRVSRRVLRKHPAHAKAIVDVQGLVKQATMGRTLSHGASMADLYGGMKEVKARRLRTAASMAIMSRRAAARARGGLSPIPDEAAMSGSASTSQLGRPSTQGNLTRPYAPQAGDGEAGVQFLGSGGSALSGSGSAVDIAKAFKGSANRAATAEDLEKAGVDVGALQILHRWCLLMSWWNPKEKASLAKGLGAKVDQEVVEHYRELGYENPEEAAAAAAVAAAAEVSEGDHVSDVFKKQGQFVNPEHLDHYTRHFKRMELERKATASNMRSTPTLKSAGEAIRAGLRMKAGSAAGSNPEDDDSEEEAQAARAHTPDEPVLTLKEARQALASLSAEEVAGLQKVDPGSPAMAVVASAICILTRSQPSWQSARALFAQPLELLSGLVNIKQGAVSERMRHVLATLMGSRRLHGLSRSRERSSGRVLSTFLRWLIALLSDSKMALSDVPLPRSARMSAVQFSYVGLEERKLARIRSRAKMAAGDASSVGERSVDSGHDRSVPTYPSNSTAKVIRFVEHFDPTKEGVCAMTARAVFRSLAWRAKMRLRQWTQAKAMDDLKLSTTLGRSRRGLLDLTRHDINTFRRQRPVTQESVIIAGGICVLLGVKPSWKYTRKVLEEPDILQFFVKLAREQIDEDSRSVVRGLLEEHGEELPRLVRASPFMLVHRFHAWFLAFTEGVEVARDAASRAASRPDSSAGTPRPGSRPASGAAAGEVAFNK